MTTTEITNEKVVYDTDCFSTDNYTYEVTGINSITKTIDVSVVIANGTKDGLSNDTGALVAVAVPGIADGQSHSLNGTDEGTLSVEDGDLVTVDGVTYWMFYIGSVPEDNVSTTLVWTVETEDYTWTVNITKAEATA